MFNKVREALFDIFKWEYSHGCDLSQASKVYENISWVQYGEQWQMNYQLKCTNHKPNSSE